MAINVITVVRAKLNTEAQPFRGVLRKRCSENMQQIYSKFTVNAVNLLHVFRTPFPKNTFEELLLLIANRKRFFILCCDYYQSLHLLLICKLMKKAFIPRVNKT